MSVDASAHYGLDMKIFQKKIYNFLGMIPATSSIDNGLCCLFSRRTSKSWLALFHLSLSGVSKYMSTWQWWRLSVQWLRKENSIEQLQAFSSLQRTWWKQWFVSLVLLWEHLSVCLHGVSRDCCWFDICDSIEQEIINNEYAQYSSRFLVVLFCLVIGVICTIGEYEEKITQKFIYVVRSRFEQSLPWRSSIFPCRKLSY